MPIDTTTVLLNPDTEEVWGYCDHCRVGFKFDLGEILSSAGLFLDGLPDQLDIECPACDEAAEYAVTVVYDD